MYKCLSYVSCEDGNFFKGVVYDHLPKNPKYHGLFKELDERKIVEVSGVKIETASSVEPDTPETPKKKKWF